VVDALCENAAFVDSLHRLVARIEPAGALNGLAQTLLRMTVPGVPDLYQGAELWDFSMVDPDNRRDVDFAVRRRLLEQDAMAGMTLADWRTGAVKQRLIARTLDLRRRHPELFARGEYLPLRAQGPCASHVVSFARLWKDDAVIVLATRLPLGMESGLRMPVMTPDLWSDTCLPIPVPLRGSQWVDTFTRAVSGTERDMLMPRNVLTALPVALLERTSDGTAVHGSARPVS
jgi:(1->4)-alpha-D-glucan 1-alpha-D-glucosylmutase